MPPTSSIRPQPVTQQLLKLVKTQQFYWFVGHVLALVSFLLESITSFIRPSSAIKYYRLTLLSILITYVIVIKQIYFRRFSFSNISVNKLARDENVHYFVLALTLYLTSYKIGVVTGSLYSFIIFAVFHVLTYFQNNLLTISVPSLATQQHLNTLINQFTLNYNQQALVVAANAEVILSILSIFQLVPAFLFELLFARNVVYFITKVFVAGVILVFVKLRYDSNQYTKAVVQQFDAKINEFILRLNNPRFVSAYADFKGKLNHYLKDVKIPKENLKKN